MLTSNFPAEQAIGADVTWATKLALVDEPPSISMLQSVKAAPVSATVQVMLPVPPEVFVIIKREVSYLNHVVSFMQGKGRHTQTVEAQGVTTCSVRRWRASSN